ncbi:MULTISPECIES: GntR family transcriptional regulator [Roseateles]|uniref:GntR family transcriptional regulator n=1 Tax=Pelomonas caseinilytica TaxID=2906763 RepID=A0ABS8X8D2_9BURK|nr:MULTISPECIES: GntR family transcriptional regulator [unclassified Roseateles]MCE4536957.1 GntR family transcriptional regulator [Pelomonas sp. P7]HEV6966658.1 GntR family transcriptional regulator [Roseateles sp.]
MKTLNDDELIAALGRELTADASSAGPLYFRLAATLRELIQQGQLASGRSLPPERELAQRLAVSRQTIRRVVDELASEGVLTVRQGSGTFVSGRLVEPLTELASFSDDMRRRGMTPGSLWLERKLTAPSPQEAFTLGLSLNDRVVRALRVRTADEQRIAVELAVVGADLVGGTADFGTSLYDAIRRHGRAPERALQRVRAAIADARIAELLHIDVGAPVLETERHSYSADGRPVEWTRSTYRGDLYDYVVEMRIGASGP